MNIAEASGLTIALYVLALCVAVNALTVWLARPNRGARDLLVQLKAHNKAIDELLETEEGRRTVATMVINESALMGFIQTIDQVAAESPTPTQAATVEAEKPVTKDGLFARFKKVAKPLGETVFGKINSYIKSRFGVPSAE